MTTPHFKRRFYVLRILIAFVVLAAVLLGLYFAAYRVYPTVAEWVEGAGHDAFIYDGTVYRCIGKRGSSGELSENKYPIADSIGRVADDGRAVGDFHNTGETAGALYESTPTLERDHAYVLYRIEKLEKMLLMLDTDGAYYIYYPEVATFASPEDHSTLSYDGFTYIYIGTAGDEGLPRADYKKGPTLGLVRNDNHLLSAEIFTEPESEAVTLDNTGMPPLEQPTPLADPYKHNYKISEVKGHGNMVMVEDRDDELLLYYREGTICPLTESYE